MKICEELGDKDKALIAEKQKLLHRFFAVRYNLKERRRKKDKEGFSLQRFSKEKVKKEKVKKTLSLENRDISSLDEGQQAFWSECQQYIGHPYDEQMVQAFFYYWAERLVKNGKMLWQSKRSWDICLRLASWAKKSYSYNDRMAASRYGRMKKKQAEDAATSSRQQQIATAREQQNARLEEEVQQAKENSISQEEYLAQNPNSNLKKFKKGC